MYLEIFLLYKFMKIVGWTNVVRQDYEKLLLDVFIVGQVGGRVNGRHLLDMLMISICWTGS